MTISNLQYESIIKNLKVGNSVAEYDNFLESARVETPIFSNLLLDEYDIISGQKGAGKTAMFRILGILSNSFFLKRNTIIISGVNIDGDSILNLYKNDFKDFTELDFENFWKLYFISLVYNNFIKNKTFEVELSKYNVEVQGFKDACYKAGLPEIPKKQTIGGMIKWVINLLPKIKSIKVPISSENPGLFTEIEFGNKEKDQVSATFPKEPLYVTEIGKSLLKILEKCNYKLWIILDKLDEVFERYSFVEFCGLRGLLRAYKSFELTKNDCFRVKLFLRDDIKLFLTDLNVSKRYFPKRNVVPLIAVTHIFAKESPLLKWSEDEISQLVLNRLILNDSIKAYLGLTNKESDDKQKLLRNKKKRLEYWNKIFPKKISSSFSLKWIYTHLKDSNGVVTPRSVIDMLEGAINYQKDKILVDEQEFSEILPVEAIKAGITLASKNKLIKDVYNEFPREQKSIEKLKERGEYKLTESDMKKLFNGKWKDEADRLSKIGILRYVKESNSYRIEFLYRPALNISYKY